MSTTLDNNSNNHNKKATIGNRDFLDSHQTISLRENRLQSIKQGDTKSMSDLVIIKNRNHDHRYHKKNEFESHDDHHNITSEEGRPKTRCGTAAAGNKTAINVGIQQPIQDDLKRNNNRNEDKVTVIIEHKRKTTSTNRDDGDDLVPPSSKTHKHVSGKAYEMINDSTNEPTKFKYVEGEKVLVYEPDQTKSRVLYDAKVLSCICPLHDKRKRIQYTINGKKTSASVARQLSTPNRSTRSNKPEYLIHFSGWSSNWDRLVSEEYIVADNEANRNLQTDLAKKAAEHLKKNKIKLNKIPAIIKEQVLKTENNLGQSDNQSQQKKMNGLNNNYNNNSYNNNLHCCYRRPTVYLDQALKYRHDHSYAEDANYAFSDNHNQKSMLDQLVSTTDSDSTAQSSTGSFYLNKSSGSLINRTLSSSQQECSQQQSDDIDYVYFKLPNEMRIYLENDRKQMENEYASDREELDRQGRQHSLRYKAQISSSVSSNNKRKVTINTNIDSDTFRPSERPLFVHKLIESACQHILNNNRQYNCLDSCLLDSDTIQVLMENFEGLLKEFQNSLEIYFDVLANGDYLYYNQSEKDHYKSSSLNRQHSIDTVPVANDNSNNKPHNLPGDCQDETSMFTNAVNTVNNRVKAIESDRPIYILNEIHLIRFIVLLPEFLNATPDLTWRHQQMISFFLNQLIKYLIENVIQSSTTNAAATTRKEKLPVDMTTQISKRISRKATNIVKRFSESHPKSLVIAEKRIKK